MNCKFIILIMLPNLAFFSASGLFGIYLNCHNNLLLVNVLVVNYKVYNCTYMY